MRYKDLDGEFAEEIKKLLKTNDFMRFDIFLISKMLGKDYSVIKINKETRLEAYYHFCEITGHRKFAASPTIKRWFGINGYAVPRREKIFEIAYALSMTESELTEWLMDGLGECDVQFNDYHEVIWLYGLVNKMTWENAEKDIEEYENRLNIGEGLKKTHTTNYLTEQFDLRKENDEQLFMDWMYSNASSFKGYSLTTLDYLGIYKDIITEYVCNEAFVRLRDLLSETDFYAWSKRRKADENQHIVQKYLYYLKRKRDRKVSEDLIENIRELNRIAHMSDNSGQKILSEIFSTSKANNEFGNLTQKHLSDLLNLPLQIERSMRAGIALNELKDKKGEEKCPVWITEFIESCVQKKVELKDTEVAVEWLRIFKAENHRRCRLVQRKDILPMILYVAQHRYIEKNDKEKKDYEQEEAKNYFIELANATLSACGMTSISKKIKLDMLLLSTFQKEEMYSYSEVIDVISEL